VNDFSNFKIGCGIVVIGIIAWYWVYIAARMITRAVMRSIEEWKERKKNGKENGREEETH